MSKVKAVLLVPFEGDPHGLLAEGLCGARPPKAWRCDERYHRMKTDHGRWFSMSEAHLPALESGGDALVLAWGGKPMWQGAAWTEGVVAALDCDETPSWRLLVNRVSRALVERRPATVNMLRRLVGDLGTLVLLDAEGREVSDE